MTNSLHNRIVALAKALCVTPTHKVSLVKDLFTNKWWLVGCVEGDTSLPQTKGCATIHEALENAEGWLAVELDKFDESKEDGDQERD
jgi:hypothetical protein